MKKLSEVARGTPTFERWQEAVRVLDAMTPEEQTLAVRAFEEGSTHWPTGLNPWSGFDLAPGIELRRSPLHWVKEIYTDRHQPKHGLVRILESPRKPMREQKLENLLSPGAHTDKLSQVGFDQARLSSGFFKTFKTAPLWDRITALRIWTCKLTGPLFKSLTAAEFKNLTMLNLEQNHLGSVGFSAAAKCKGLEALTALHLGLNDLDVSAMGSLATMAFAPRLRWLNLGYNPVHDAGLDQLAGGGLSALATLDVNHCPVGQNTDTWSRGLSGLEALVLDNTSVTNDGLTALTKNLPRLERLSISATSVGDDGAFALASGEHSWRSLGLSSTKITPKGLAALLRSQNAQSLERLELGAGLDMPTVKLLIDGACPRLCALWVNVNEVGDGVEAAINGDRRLAAIIPH